MPDRLYTTAELDSMGVHHLTAPVAQAAPPDAPAPDALASRESAALAGDIESGFSAGVGTAMDRTMLGLKQAYQYVAGDDEGRQKINAAVKALDDRKSSQTTAGKVGEAFGTAIQFAIPQGGAASLARVAPAAMLKGARALMGAPGSIGRAAVQGGAYEAVQPVNPGDVGTDEYLMQKGLQTGMGAAGGAAVGKVAKMLTSSGVPVPADRQGMVDEAKRLGITLTPAERTGNRDHAIREAYLASHRGSGGVMAGLRDEKQALLNQKSAEALGSEAAAPTEAVLAQARAEASKGYEPIANIPAMSFDEPYALALDTFIAKQGKKALGSDEASKIAMKLKNGAATGTGSEFLEDLQGIKDLSFAARQSGDVNTSKQLGDLSTIMEDYAGRRVGQLAKDGSISPDAMERFKAARAAYAKIHAVEKAVDPVTGNVSANKYLNQEFKRAPASKGPGKSAVAEDLRDAGAVARVMRQSAPPVSSSGTAERLEGGAGGLLNAGKNYLAAKMHLKYGGQAGPLGAVLGPSQNAMVRRLMPGVAFSAEEGMQ